MYDSKTLIEYFDLYNASRDKCNNGNTFNRRLDPSHIISIFRDKYIVYHNLGNLKFSLSSLYEFNAHLKCQQIQFSDAVLFCNRDIRKHIFTLLLIAGRKNKYIPKSLFINFIIPYFIKCNDYYCSSLSTLPNGIYVRKVHSSEYRYSFMYYLIKKNDHMKKTLMDFLFYVISNYDYNSNNISIQYNYDGSKKFVKINEFIDFFYPLIYNFKSYSCYHFNMCDTYKYYHDGKILEVSFFVIPSNL